MGFDPTKFIQVAHEEDCSFSKAPKLPGPTLAIHPKDENQDRSAKKSKFVMIKCRKDRLLEPQLQLRKDMDLLNKPAHSSVTGICYDLTHATTEPVDCSSSGPCSTDYPSQQETRGSLKRALAYTPRVAPHGLTKIFCGPFFTHFVSEMLKSIKVKMRQDSMAKKSAEANAMKKSI